MEDKSQPLAFKLIADEQHVTKIAVFHLPVARGVIIVSVEDAVQAAAVEDAVQAAGLALQQTGAMDCGTLNGRVSAWYRLVHAQLRGIAIGEKTKEEWMAEAKGWIGVLAVSMALRPKVFEIVDMAETETALGQEWLRGGFCANCFRHKHKGGLRMCSKCHTETYCSKECQEDDYSAHKPTCIEASELGLGVISPRLIDRLLDSSAIPAQSHPTWTWTASIIGKSFGKPKDKKRIEALIKVAGDTSARAEEIRKTDPKRAAEIVAGFKRTNAYLQAKNILEARTSAVYVPTGWREGRYRKRWKEKSGEGGGKQRGGEPDADASEFP